MTKSISPADIEYILAICEKEPRNVSWDKLVYAAEYVNGKSFYPVGKTNEND